MSKFLVVKRDTGSKQFGHDYKDCKILKETDDLNEAMGAAFANGYEPNSPNYGGVRVWKEVTVTAKEADDV